MTLLSNALPWARRCIWAGVVLSGLLLVPFIKLSEVTRANWMIDPILYMFIVSPFLLLAVLLRFAPVPRRILFLTIPYLACHAILTAEYLISVPQLHEFGYLGLFLVPFYESIVALPVGVVLVLVADALAKRAIRARIGG